MRSIITKVFLLMFISICSAQEFDVEKLLDSEEFTEDQTILVDYLEQLYDSPLNVNTASAKELSTLPWLSTIAAVRIIQYRHEHGAFQQLEELQQVHGVKSIYDKIAPFLTVGKKPISIPVHVQGRHRVLSCVEQSKAFQDNLYAGSKEKIYNRIKGTVSEHIQIGALVEKDAGEKNWNDLSLGNIIINPGFSSTIMIGHLAAEFGQGLVFSGPYKMFKGSDPIAPAKQRSRGLVPYLSTAENYAFQGVGISTQLQQFEIHAFTSRQAKDARLENKQIQSLPQTGLHRTLGEWSRRDQLAEDVSGMAVEAQWGESIHVGGVWQRSVYDHSFATEEFADLHDFSGTFNQVIGFNFDFSFNSLNTFGELAQSASGGQALLAGLLYDRTPLEIVAVYRQYDKDFHNFYALGFGERSDTRNENGFYAGLSYHLNVKTKICYYIDQWQSPWLHTFIPMPSSGYDMLFSIEHESSSFLTLNGQFRYEKKDTGMSSTDSFGNPVRFVHRPQRSKFRFQIDYEPNRQVRLRSRLELTDYDDKGQLLSHGKVGTLLYQDLRWRPHTRLTLYTRWTLFDAPSYNFRFYQFENDLPGVMRLKMLNGRGKRWYLLCSLKLNKKLKMTIKYENLYSDAASTIGSGNDMIFSPYENVVSAQLDWRF